MPLATGSQKVGIVAGGGQFPVLLCRAARDQGRQVVVTALEGDADPRLTQEADELTWFKLGQLGKIIATFRQAGVDQAVMAGSVTKGQIFSGKWRPDRKFLSILPRIRSLHDDSVLRLFAEILTEEGISVLDSTFLLPSLLTPPGRLTKRRPTKREFKDADYGFRLAKDLGRFDIGQCIVVRLGGVLAVEAQEGTDETIRRGGRLGQGRAVVVKVAKPHQDLRFDLPSVGLTTIQTMKDSGCTALVLEAGRTLCFDRQEMVALADKYGIAVLAMEEPSP
ncbi:MAG: UDP-2,3-diacylglucosamine diphosphatase LpxI [Deltaproteobacteria bacterium]|nr:UDP-2,3-diacylglucosamine diphosphatase LpxI [Deltaproteobacteria bacterium]